MESGHFLPLIGTSPRTEFLGATSSRREPTLHVRLLVALTQRPAVRRIPDDASAVLAEPEWRASFLRLARELGVEGLALKALKTTPLADSLPPDVARQLAERLEQLRRQALLWDLERDRVLHALKRREVTPVLLKGSALRERVYDDPTERSMGDLDLLVTREEVERSMDALREAGYASDSAEVLDAYRLRHFHYLLTHPRGFIVELHWALTQPGSQVPLDEKRFLARAATSSRRNNVPVRVPSAEELLLHVVSQNEDDAFGLLRRVVDLDRIVALSPRLDWPYVARAATDSGLDLVLAVSLRLAQVLLRTDVPSDLSRGTGLPILSRIHLALLDPVTWVVSLPSERRAAAFDAVRLWCAGTWRARARRVRETMRGSRSVAPVVDGAEVPHRWRVADSGAVRAAKLGIYHLLVYWRSGLSLVSRSGRRRLRFWS
jgi:hypothetical protein